jgi:ribose transport system permease protein
MSAPMSDQAAPIASGPGDSGLGTGGADFQRRVRTRRGLRFQHIQDYGIIVLGVALFIYFSFTAPHFLTGVNLLNIVYQNSVVGIVACVLTITIISGNFDLSVGAMFALSGVIAAWVGVHWTVWLSLPVALIAATAMGLGNGLIVAKLRVDPFLATLSTALIFGGIALGITGGFLIKPKEGADVFTFLGQSGIVGISYSTIIFVVVAVVSQFALSFTRFGRRIYALGGNSVAARLSGVKIHGLVVATFALTGLAAGLSGFLDASFTGTGSASVGPELALTAISAVALGGTSIFGGSGAVWRTVVGVLILGMLSNGFDLAGLPTYWQSVVKGALIVGVISIQAAAKGR